MKSRYEEACFKSDLTANKVLIVWSPSLLRSERCEAARLWPGQAGCIGNNNDVKWPEREREGRGGLRRRDAEPWSSQLSLPLILAWPPQRPHTEPTPDLRTRGQAAALSSSRAQAGRVRGGGVTELLSCLNTHLVSPQSPARSVTDSESRTWL